MDHTYIIPVDLASITRNKDAGSTSITVAGPRTFHFTCYRLPKEFVDGENVIITFYRKVGENPVLYPEAMRDLQGEFLSMELFEKCKSGEVPNVDVEIRQEHQRHICAPIPSHSFRYINTELLCGYCETPIMSNDLKSDSNGFGYSDAICPKCGAWDCCEVDYETLESALKRLGN